MIRTGNDNVRSTGRVTAERISLHGPFFVVTLLIMLLGVVSPANDCSGQPVGQPAGEFPGQRLDRPALPDTTELLPEPDDLHARVYLIGDAGGATGPGSLPAVNTLARMLRTASTRSTVAFLGDNVYCCGIPDSSDARFELAAMRLYEQLEATRDFTGRVVFIPGNHDWGDAGAYSARTLARQADMVRSFTGDEESFVPFDGLPGPHEIELTDRVRIIAIDTQWWLMDDQPTGEAGEYDIHEEADFLMHLEELISKRDDEDLLVLGHHPMRSTGVHGGRVPPSRHLFPLRDLSSRLWIPLPVLGSAYVLTRSVVGGRQDIAHWKYGSLARSLEQIFGHAESRIVYASGHDHSLQHIVRPDAHYLISGSGSRPAYAAESRDAPFVYDDHGFMVLDYLEDGKVVLHAIGTPEDGSESAVLYSSELYEPLPETADPDTRTFSTDPPTSITLPEMVSTAVQPSLSAGAVKRLFMGAHHREAWTTPVEVEVFDVGVVAGGLTPVKRGGGMQTTSVRFEDRNGHEFVLRSIDKDPTRSIPEYLRETIAGDIVIDQVAILNPFGALMIPPLARAADLYYASPRLFWVPDDPRLEPFTDLLAGRVMQFERRPDDDMSHLEQFGRSEDVESPAKMARDLRSDNDDRVDTQMFARARLFDMFISDWDRHEDQWRWAAFEDPDGKGRIFRPIGRDRDWAFNRMDGLFPTLLKQPFVMPKFQDFRPEYGVLHGLNRNGLSQDRRLTADLTRRDWVEQGRFLESAITDAVIDSAITSLPPEVRGDYREEYTHTFRARRDQLPEIAGAYSDMISRLVDIVGSDKHERFDIELFTDSVTVVVNKTLREGDDGQVIYRRTFFPDETEEIRLYGFGGIDRYRIHGAAPSPIRIHAVGGAGQDTFTDETEGNGRRRFIVHDTIEGSSLSAGPSTTDRRTSDPDVNRYDPDAYWFEAPLPIIILGSNSDEGLVLGAGVVRTSYRFRREPYSTRQRVRARVSTRNASIDASYDGHFTEQFGRWGIRVELAGQSPNTLRNFYGFGNETSETGSEAAANDLPDAFRETRLGLIESSAALTKTSGEILTVTVGPTIEYVDVREDEGRFAVLSESQRDVASNDGRVYAGLAAGFDAVSVDNPVMPLTGFRWTTSATARLPVSDGKSGFTSLATDLRIYSSTGPRRRSTVGLRVGAAHVNGPFPYYFAPTLGGSDNLRGWRSTRFTGRTSFYQSVELRREIFTFATLLAAGRAGVNLFLDNGRVWYDDESSSRWHQGWGGGIWLNLFDLAVVRFDAAVSKERTAFSTGVGFSW